MKPAFLFFAALLTLPTGVALGRAKKGSVVAELADTAGLAVTRMPVDGEVCFSPVERCDLTLTKFVTSAKESIDLAIYDINLDKLVHEIIAASKKIKVRIVVDRRQAKGNHSLVPLLIKAGTNLRYGHQRGIFHNKFVIIDGKMIETGSFNHTNHASIANNENQIYLSSPKIVDRYKKRFEEVWAQADEPK